MLGWIAVIALCLYVGLAAMIYLAQRSLMYFPDTVARTPAAAGLPEAKEVPLTASDGAQIRVWHVPPQDGKPVILYFHGNGGALNYRVERFHKLIADGIGLVALEYRGYGGLSGSPSEQGLIARRRSGLRLRGGALSGAADRAVGQVARLRSRGCAGRGKTGRPRHPGSAVHLGARRRRTPLLVSAGAASDERSIPLRRAHRARSRRRF